MIKLYTGVNDFLIRQAIDSEIAEFVQKFGAHAVEKLDAVELEPARLGELLQGASLFASEKLVVLHNPSASKLLWEALETWVEKVPAETTLLLVDQTPDKRTKTYKSLLTHSEVREFGELSDSELRKWLQESASKQSGTLNTESADYLLEKVGPNQWRLWEELQKLLNYNPVVSKQAIDELVESTGRATAFELLDAVMNQQPEQIDRLLESVAANEDPYKFMGLLISQIHALAVVKASGDKAVDQVAKDSGLHPFVIRKTLSLARPVTLEKLHDIIAMVALCDEQLKSSGFEPWFLISQCLHRLVHVL